LKIFNVLFLCTGNSARSILAEALTTTLSQGRFIGFSAGSKPTGKVHPIAEALAIEMGYPKKNLRSKSWEEFSKPDAPHMDFIITVCDNAANEACPIWLGHPATAHWGFPDPASIDGNDQDKRLAFQKILDMIKRDIELFIKLPLESLNHEVIKKSIQAIHSYK
jgi:arsenate reductase (thioredoxin)